MYGRFTKSYVDVLKKNMQVVSINDFKLECCDIFYNYTDRLVEMLLSEQFEVVVNDYIKYRGY